MVFLAHACLLGVAHIIQSLAGVWVNPYAELARFVAIGVLLLACQYVAESRQLTYQNALVFVQAFMFGCIRIPFNLILPSLNGPQLERENIFLELGVGSMDPLLEKDSRDAINEVFSPVERRRGIKRINCRDASAPGPSAPGLCSQGLSHQLGAIGNIFAIALDKI